MAIRTVLQIGDETLRKKSFEVTDFGEKTKQLLDDMKETLDKEEGVGLAAPQIGVLRRIFIVSYQDVYLECINPVISKLKGKSVDTEGCLSVRGRSGNVERPTSLVLDAFDRNGNPYSFKINGYLARIICHEYDHLDG
ncbi:MAG: peptide deformylase, partial [Clostridia bacterium]|nr:peptide deformylase [Clostridia bacterium]